MNPYIGMLYGCVVVAGLLAEPPIPPPFPTHAYTSEPPPAYLEPSLPTRWNADPGYFYKLQRMAITNQGLGWSDVPMVVAWCGPAHSSESDAILYFHTNEWAIFVSPTSNAVMVTTNWRGYP